MKTGDIKESNQRIDVGTLKSERVRRCLETFDAFQAEFRNDPEGAVQGEGAIIIIVKDDEVQSSIAGSFDPVQIAHLCEMFETMRNAILKDLLKMTGGGLKGGERLGLGWGENPK